MGHTVGSPLEKDHMTRTVRQGGTAVLTLGEESVSVDTPRGHEAEDTIRDIILLSERLIQVLVRSQEER